MSFYSTLRLDGTTEFVSTIPFGPALVSCCSRESTTFENGGSEITMRFKFDPERFRAEVRRSGWGAYQAGAILAKFAKLGVPLNIILDGANAGMVATFLGVECVGEPKAVDAYRWPGGSIHVDAPFPSAFKTRVFAVPITRDGETHDILGPKLVELLSEMVDAVTKVVKPDPMTDLEIVSGIVEKLGWGSPAFTAIRRHEIGFTRGLEAVRQCIGIDMDAEIRGEGLRLLDAAARQFVMAADGAIGLECNPTPERIGSAIVDIVRGASSIGETSDPEVHAIIEVLERIDCGGEFREAVGHIARGVSRNGLFQIASDSGWCADYEIGMLRYEMALHELELEARYKR